MKMEIMISFKECSTEKHTNYKWRKGLYYDVCLFSILTGKGVLMNYCPRDSGPMVLHHAYR